MDIRVCISIVLLLQVVLAVHRRPTGHGIYGPHPRAGNGWSSHGSGRTRRVTGPVASRSRQVPSHRRQWGVQAAVRSWKGHAGHPMRRKPPHPHPHPPRPLRAMFMSRVGHRNKVQAQPPQLREFRANTAAAAFGRPLATIYIPPETTTTSTTTTTASPLFGLENNFLQILQERQSVIRNEHDRELITYYLYELHKLGSLDGVDADLILDKQVELIDSITDMIVKREVLKIFVKDMVERSGFLHRNATAQDLDVLSALIDKITVITADLSANEQSLIADVAGSTVDEGVDTFGPFADLAQGAGTVVDAIPIVNQFPSTGSNDRNVLHGNSRRTFSDTISRRTTLPSNHRTLSANPSQNRNMLPSNTRTLSDSISAAGKQILLDEINSRTMLAARPAIVGMSIYGERIPGLRKRGPPTTVLPPTTTKREPDVTMISDAAAAEVLGGESAYWGHLRAGLVDMLCALCRKQGRSGCIKRYCTSNDSLVVRQGATTPTPQITAPL